MNAREMINTPKESPRNVLQHASPEFSLYVHQFEQESVKAENDGVPKVFNVVQFRFELLPARGFRNAPNKSCRT